MTDKEAVLAAIPDAELYGFSHGKVQIYSPTEGPLRDVSHHGTRDKRCDDAWKSARQHPKVVAYCTPILDSIEVGDPIWGMVEDDGKIGLRLDCGDMGTLRLTKVQAIEIRDTLDKMIPYAG